MIIFTQRIVNKLSFGAISLDLTCFYLGGGGKSSSIAGFGLCDILCHSEQMRRIAILRLQNSNQNIYDLGSRFQPNTFTPTPSLPSHLITQSLSHFSSNRGAAA